MFLEIFLIKSFGLLELFDCKCFILEIIYKFLHCLPLRKVHSRRVVVFKKMGQCPIDSSGAHRCILLWSGLVNRRLIFRFSWHILEPQVKLLSWIQSRWHETKKLHSKFSSIQIKTQTKNGELSKVTCQKPKCKIVWF